MELSRYRDPFDLARKIAGKTDPLVTNYYHSSVILDRRGRIISSGVNHFAGNSIIIDEGLLAKTVHAEIHALTKVGIRRLSGAILINYGRTNVATNMSRPCPNCMAIIKRLGFRKVFYSVRSRLDKPMWMEERL